MTLTALTAALCQSPLLQDVVAKLGNQGRVSLGGAPRPARALIAAALGEALDRPLVVITATLEEATLWTGLLEAFSPQPIACYPTSEGSPYEVLDPENEILWGQLQVLSDTLGRRRPAGIVAAARALQPHLPPSAVFEGRCLTLSPGCTLDLKTLGQRLSQLGYSRVDLVESEGQWSQRGDLVDIYPVAAELPTRLEWLGDTLERLREFDPGSQRSLDPLASLTLTPTDYQALVTPGLTPDHITQLRANTGGWRRYLGLAYGRPANLLDYVPADSLVILDEPHQTELHQQRWLDHVSEHWQSLEPPLPAIHRSWPELTAQLDSFTQVQLTELASGPGLNLAGRPVPLSPHQFARLADFLRDQRQQGITPWLVSAQPSRCVALLQEHDCPAQFVPNPQDSPAIERLRQQKVPIALKYTGLAELQGFSLPSFRFLLVTDREFFGQHSLATPGYVRRRRRATSTQVDVQRLRPGDYVVHRQHGFGQFLRLEHLVLDNQTREYLVIQYADGLLRVAVDQVGVLSRYRGGDKAPELHALTGKTWEKTREKVRKSLKKLAVDLIKLYAERSQQQRPAYGPDSPWQQELEESFPYPLTPDQAKAIQQVKHDLETPQPMDRLVCGDVGFGKTEVAIRGIFKVVVAGKQVALLAPTTVLAQQHYHTLKERFAPYPVQVALLNRFRTTQEKQAILQRLASGELDVVVGTHQLLGKGVKFRDLGLLVVDEEQRFGVNQKERIKALKTQVDVLTLTATPIPRTLHMTLSGLRDISLITTPPAGRRPIKTHLAPYDPESIRSAICQELDRGGQVFYVVPRVEGIDQVAAQLQQMVPSARIQIAHGQLAPEELEVAMLAFANGEADVLVCTTLVESGLDIPRVNTILVEEAQRFGLAQLYQLRGRVGRAGTQAYAWLFYPAGRALSEEARQRLQAIQEFTQLGSGYQLALRDLEIRGTGNLLGAEQSGQVAAVGFDLYMDMLQEALQEIQGQAIPQVEDTQIDLKVSAFIPSEYIPDVNQKLAAYRSVAAVDHPDQLVLTAADWTDRYGPLPPPAQQLLRVMALKQVARRLGFTRIRPEGKQHIILDTPMAEAAWKSLHTQLPDGQQARWVYSPGRVTVRGLGVLPAPQQIETLITALETLNASPAT
ncbi:MAG: transcription-repair coupling factor [Gloeomargaritaceae cyanobacterium C42_A2020_066]|nr:transcription-repair coupling factor [Gloeomargaritaceae cyanobacterium C42_A2020_066]